MTYHSAHIAFFSKASIKCLSSGSLYPVADSINAGAFRSRLSKDLGNFALSKRKSCFIVYSQSAYTLNCCLRVLKPIFKS